MSISKLTIWTKPTAIHVDCFTPLACAAIDNPIAKASHFVPDWWKKLDRTHDVLDPHTNMVIPRSTMKGCVGFLELYNNGIIMPLWSDVALYVDKNGFRYNFAINEGAIISHGSKQHGDHFSNQINLKMESVWALKEKRGVKFLFTGCTWSMAKVLTDITVLTGVLDFKNQHTTHINMFCKVNEKPGGYILEAGMPFVHLIPLSDKKVIPHVQRVSAEEFVHIRSEWQPYKFVGGFRERIKKLGAKNGK